MQNDNKALILLLIVLFTFASCGHSSISDFDTLREYTQREYSGIKMKELKKICRQNLKKNKYLIIKDDPITEVLTSIKEKEKGEYFKKQKRLEIMFREHSQEKVVVLIQIALGKPIDIVNRKNPKPNELEYIKDVNFLFDKIDKEVKKNGGRVVN